MGQGVGGDGMRGKRMEGVGREGKLSFFKNPGRSRVIQAYARASPPFVQKGGAQGGHQGPDQGRAPLYVIKFSNLA